MRTVLYLVKLLFYGFLGASLAIGGIKAVEQPWMFTIIMLIVFGIEGLRWGMDALEFKERLDQATWAADQVVKNRLKELRGKDDQ